MVILGIVSTALVILAIIFIFIRLLFDLRFTSIQKEPDQSLLFRRKISYLRRIEQDRHIRYLLISSLTVGIAIMLLLVSFLLLAKDYQRTQRKNAHLESRVEDLAQQQEQLAASIPLKNYPEEGIGLKDYDWNKWAAEEKDSDVQKELESVVSQTIVPYFGSFHPIVSLSIPKTLSIQLKGQLNDDESKERIKKNLDNFAMEAEGISELTAIHVRIIFSVGQDQKELYNVNYTREKAEDTFNKKNVSEQKLKNDGEKG